MNTVKNINANGTMSNLVGLWAVIRNQEGKRKYRVFIYGKADDDHYLVQAICCLSGYPNVIKIFHINEMLEWEYYASAELLLEEMDRENATGAIRYKFDKIKEGKES